jgi:DUF1016 N-terminal domain
LSLFCIARYIEDYFSQGSSAMGIDLVFYGRLLDDLKPRTRRSQLKASLAVNAEMILLYWDIGQMIHQRQQQEGWGASIFELICRAVERPSTGILNQH